VLVHKLRQGSQRHIQSAAGRVKTSRETVLALYIVVFPFYASHYLGSGNLAASAGFALVALVRFYYFGFILLIGAEEGQFGALLKHLQA
jgi:hypothetical protein